MTTKLDDVLFIQLKTDQIQGEIHLKKEYPLPIFLPGVENRSVQSTDFHAGEILQGILLLYGWDENFHGKDYYASLLEAVDAKSLLTLIHKNYPGDIPKAWRMLLGFHRLLSETEDSLLMLWAYAKEEEREGNREPLDYTMDFLARRFELLDADLLQALAHEYYFQENYQKVVELTASSDHDELKNLRRVSGDQITFQQGERLLQASRFTEAIERFSTLAESYPNWYELHFYLGLAWKMEGNYTLAMKSFEQALSAKRTAQVLNEVALCEMVEGDVHRAEQLFAEALTLQPDDPELNNNYGVALLHLGNHEQALAIFEKLSQADPQDDVAAQWLAIVKDRLNTMARS